MARIRIWSEQWAGALRSEPAGGEEEVALDDEQLFHHLGLGITIWWGGGSYNIFHTRVLSNFDEIFIYYNFT